MKLSRKPVPYAIPVLGRLGADGVVTPFPEPAWWTPPRAAEPVQEPAEPEADQRSA